MKTRWTLALCLIIFAAGSQAEAVNAKTVWLDMIANCGESLSLPKGHVLYFGPSNIGPGTILSTTKPWYKFWTSVPDEVRLQRTLADTGLSKKVIAALVDHGPDYGSCVTGHTQNYSIGLSALLESNAGAVWKIDPKLKTCLAKATKLTASVDHWNLDELVGGRFLDCVVYTKASSGNPLLNYRRDLYEPGQFIVCKALRVYGFTANIELSNQAKAQLKAAVAALPKLQLAGKRFKLAKGKASLVAESVDSNTLQIKAPASFYVAGVVARVKRTQKQEATCYVPPSNKKPATHGAGPLKPSTPAGEGTGSSKPDSKSVFQYMPAKHPFM